MQLSRAWKISLWQLLGLVVAAATIGWWLNALTYCLLALFVSYLAITLWHVHRLEASLRLLHRAPPTKSSGIWSELHNLLSRRQHAEFLRKRRLVALLRAFRDAATALPDATVVLGQTQRILWFNDAATRWLGLKYPQDIGSYFSSLVRAPRVAEWLSGSAAKEPLADVPSPLDDTVRLSLRMIPYGSEQSLLVARDISNVLRLEQVRRDFVANVSHELRTPLTVVHGYLDILEPEQMPEWDSILRELRIQSQRMTQIVEDLLTLSRLEAQESLPEERVVMHSLLLTLKREAEGLSQGKHCITLDISSKNDLKGSAKELHSAFSNLITNAVRYTPAGGRITIQWSDADRGGRFAVSDTGQGISPQHIPRITERFYRVSTSRSRETGGTGLGLSIVKHVLNLHHAHLEIQSAVSIGSTFICVFDSEHLLTPQSLVEET